MTSAETPATSSPKSSTSGWQKPTVMILGIVFWIMLGAIVTFSLIKPKQDLLITNTSSQTVDIVNASAPWWDRKVLTLHPDMSFICMFRDGDEFRITRSDEETPKPGTTPPASPLPSRSESWGSALSYNSDGSGTIVIKHASRTAEVRVNEAGKVEFEFTDL
jgi:hypothetical protein